MTRVSHANIWSIRVYTRLLLLEFRLTFSFHHLSPRKLFLDSLADKYLRLEIK